MKIRENGDVLSRGKVNELLTNDLSRLERELESPRLSAMRSTLGLAVPYAALRSILSGMTGEAPPRTEEVPASCREAPAHAA